MLPPLDATTTSSDGLRRHPRHTLKCAAELRPVGHAASQQPITIVEISAHGFQARAIRPLQVGLRCTVAAELAEGVRAHVEAEIVRKVSSDSGQLFGFRVDDPDPAWQRCVAWLEAA